MKEDLNIYSEKQQLFFQRFIKPINPDCTIDNDYCVINGSFIIFNKKSWDLSEGVYKAIKYLSFFRIKGRPIPANIILVALDNEKIYVYSSRVFIDEIEKVCSDDDKTNAEILADYPNYIYNYSNGSTDELDIIKILQENSFTKIHIDENCVIGWASTYYRQFPFGSKADFINEIRNPFMFKKYIHKYEDISNIKFQYLMDRLNDDMQKKKQGVFYTPIIYAKKAIELVRKAIERVPAGNDYVIIDRCAGTGNLESLLSDEEKSHTILSTIDFYEYQVLLEGFGDKARHIIHPLSKNGGFNWELANRTDALSEEFIENPIISQYINDDKCTIILYENPPYVSTTSLYDKGNLIINKSATWKDSFVVSEMKKEMNGLLTNDLSNVFIWSGFKYYLRQYTDSYIVLSPVKYWKAHHLINKEFICGFGFNRRYFNTNVDACVMAALWSNKAAEIDEICIDGFDICKNGELVEYKNLPVKRVHELYSNRYYDKNTFDDAVFDGIHTGLNGLEAAKGIKRRMKPMYSSNMLGYLVADSVGFDNPDTKSSLLVAGRYNGNGCYIRKDNYLDKLPMFAASRYIHYNRQWTERGRIMKSADGYKRYCRDVNNGKLEQYLLKVLIFTIFEKQNHMRTFYGSDGRLYRNELCLDTTNGSTVASRDIKKLVIGRSEQELLEQWNILFKNAQATPGYNPLLTYGVYQIHCELDTSHKKNRGNSLVYDNMDLHEGLQKLKKLVAKYYENEIVPLLFEYEFLK